VAKPLSPLPCLPWDVTETRSVIPVNRSRTNTSTRPLVSAATRLVASDSNAMCLPCAETAGQQKVAPFVCLSEELIDTRTVLDPQVGTSTAAPAVPAPMIRNVG